MELLVFDGWWVRVCPFLAMIWFLVGQIYFMVGLATEKVWQHKLDPLEKEKSNLNMKVGDSGELIEGESWHWPLISAFNCLRVTIQQDIYAHTHTKLKHVKSNLDTEIKTLINLF